MENALHLATKHFIEDASPMSSGKLLNKVKVAMASAADADKALDLDVLNIELNRIEAKLLGDEAGKDHEDGEFNVADTIRKALTLITQVWLYFNRYSYYSYYSYYILIFFVS